MSFEQGAITIEAVREQLRLLGHSDIPDSIISTFLKDLHTEVAEEQNMGGESDEEHSSSQPTRNEGEYPLSAQDETAMYRQHAPSQPRRVVGSDSRGFVFNEGDACEEVEVVPRLGVDTRNMLNNTSESFPIDVTSSINSLQDNGSAIKIPVSVTRYSKMDDIFPTRSFPNASSSNVDEEVSDDEMAFLTQTYAEHGFAYGGRKKTARRTTDAQSTKPSRLSESTESSRLKMKRPDSAPSRPKARVAPRTPEKEDRPLTARSSTGRVSSARRPLFERTNKTSPSKSIMSCTESVTASRVGSIIVDAKKPAKIDRVARYAQLQQSWSKDTFLTATKKPRTTPNFHLLFASQHAKHATEVSEAKMRKPKKASSYVAPQDKRRDSLRWEVRVNLLNKETV
eukprot:CAMPEP_0198205146 /NCGR_PEP_ID=MMETSP1445-20131203/8624_1 /TAXON_ID=36898 /ORGANISM="Pyramimonas sp., Strain CCMP2087" /LENGTH=396 /DNA_ID=CAMNT_0043877309 /DNA_START=117 /DNA_END=1307 /DNA_ORIENTATION=-